MKAVRDRRIYLAPNLPYGWFDAPPGVNGQIGVRWLASILSKAVPGDTTRTFYKLFYSVELTDELIDTLLSPATSPKREQ